MLDFSDGESRVVIDEHLAPIYFAAWIGEPTAAIARRYVDWSTQLVQRALSTKTPCAVVIDVSEGARPTARVRAAIAAMSEETPRAESLVAVYVSAPRALVRGAITAMQWISRKPWPMTMVSSVEDGAKRAVTFLRHVGSAPPTGFDPAQCPRLTR